MHVLVVSVQLVDPKGELVDLRLSVDKQSRRPWHGKSEKRKIDKTGIKLAPIQESSPLGVAYQNTDFKAGLCAC